MTRTCSWGVLLLPRPERPGGSSANETTALGVVPQDDAERVRQVVEELAEPVVLVGRSYGGMVITELADHPAVALAVYPAAFRPRPGRSVKDFLGGELPNWVVPHDNDTVTVTEDFEVARDASYADIEPGLAADDPRRLQPRSISSLSAPRSPRKRTHLVTYNVCEQDNALPVKAR